MTVYNVDKILKTLADASVTLKINKSHFSQREVEYLGHMVKQSFLEILKTNFTSLGNVESPKNNGKIR